jgi:arylsulfotransferase ASST
MPRGWGHPEPGTIASMLGGGQRRLALAASSALVIAGLVGAPAGTEAAPPYGQVSFRVPSLFPKFGRHIHDYVVRCNDRPVTVKAHVSGGWEAAIANHPYRSGDFREVVPLRPRQDFPIAVRQVGHTQRSLYHVRCLPSDFPKYTFARHRPVSPKFFSVDREYFSRYAIIFDNHGVPIWWYHAPAHGTRVLMDGTILWFDESSKHYEIHRLDGSLVRTLDAVGQPANPHDLQLLGNGDSLVGAYVKQRHVDTSAYGGSSDASVGNTELQQVSPGGQLLWDWKSQDHISLAETGRHWPRVVSHPTRWGYDIVHWNSIEPDGNSVIASFRHLDAVYKIEKSTGRIVWKLGGRTTPKSLTVKHDRHHYTFGAQHDARLLPDGTLTVFDNRTKQGNRTPRAARYRIDQKAGTATLLQSITDPGVPKSNCCGSARRLPNRDWLIDWGKNNPICGYNRSGKRTFRLTFDSNFSYRAEPVPTGVLSAPDLREGMRAMAPARK